MANRVKAALVYFLLVFAAGFVLGPIRILFVVPAIGARAAELGELPIMLAATILAARWVVRLFALPPQSAALLTVGFLALALMLVAEFTVVLRARGMTLSEYFQTVDPVSGPAYYATQLAFGLMPWIVGRHGSDTSTSTTPRMKAA